MARRRRDIQPKVRLRPLTRSEQRILRAKLRDLKLPVRLHRRYQIVAAACEAASVPAVAQRVGCDVTTAYHWVARFNLTGFARSSGRRIRGAAFRSSPPSSCAS